MTLPPVLQGRLRIPVVGAPMFIVSQPELVVAQCTSGIVGAFPALNARPPELLDAWLTQIAGDLAAWDAAHPDRPAAPFAVNQIVHKSNDRLAHDRELCVKHRVPIVITSLGAREDVNQAVHSYGGIVLHDIINVVHAKKAIDKGGDGLIAVCDCPRLLSGASGNGRSVLAAQALGADLAYIGSAFIATTEAHASDRYKAAIVEPTAPDIIYTNPFPGV